MKPRHLPKKNTRTRDLREKKSKFQCSIPDKDLVIIEQILETQWD